MHVAFDLLRTFEDGKFYSGTQLAQKYNVSRSTVFKGVEYLRKLGLDIQAISGKGYRWHYPASLLDKKAILEAFDAHRLPFSPRVDIVNATTSTNDYLISRLSHGLNSPTVCIAETQLKGRGRQGKVWHSPLGGSLYFSLYWRSAKSQNALGCLSLVAGLALLSALEHVAPLPDAVGIKWPNDIWFQDKKLAGILVETFRSVSENVQPQTDVIIGIGVNFIRPHKEITPSHSTSLESLWGKAPTRNTFSGALIAMLCQQLSQFEEEGFAPFLATWQRFDRLFNQPITLYSQGQEEPALAKGINLRGELLILKEGVHQAIRHGDVSIRPNFE